MKSLYLNSPYPQPVDGGTGQNQEGHHEFVDLLPNTSIRIWYSAQSRFYPSHWHEEIEIIACYSGAYTIRTADHTYCLKEGDILLTPGGVEHSMDMTSDCHGFVYLMNLACFQQIPTFSSVFSSLKEPLYLPSGHSALYQSCSVLLAQMRDEYFSENEFRELVIYSLMLNFIAQIGQKTLPTSRSYSHMRTDKQQEYIQKFNEVLTWINQHYAEDISLDSISRKFGFSKYHFSRLFGQYTRYTFWEYLTLQRLKAAEELLRKTNLPVTTVAEQSGFHSPSSFSKAFRDQYHCTPSEFRKTLL